MAGPGRLNAKRGGTKESRSQANVSTQHANPVQQVDTIVMSGTSEQGPTTPEEQVENISSKLFIIDSDYLIYVLII